MTENGFKNNFQINIIECPRCHIKLSKKEMQLHNIKCRMINNQKEKDGNIQRDEYKTFMDKIPDMQMDDKNIKIIMKKFIEIFGNKIELLENNIHQVNVKIKRLYENNTRYLQKIDDTLDNLNSKYINKSPLYTKKDKDNTYKRYESPNKKSLFYKNETDVHFYENPNQNFENYKKLKANKSNNKKRHSEFLNGEIAITNNEYKKYFYSKRMEKKQFMSATKIIDINKETVTQFKVNNKIYDDNNKKFKKILKREKNKDYKYKQKYKAYTSRIFDNNDKENENIMKCNNINIKTDGNMINITGNNLIQMDMRRSLSHGNIINLTNKDNNVTQDENEGDINSKDNNDDDGNDNNGNNVNDNEDNADDNEVIVDSLNIIMQKLSNLEETLINLGLNEDDIKQNFFNLKSKDLDYSNTESFHSEPE